MAAPQPGCRLRACHPPVTSPFGDYRLRDQAALAFPLVETMMRLHTNGYIPPLLFVQCLHLRLQRLSAQGLCASVFDSHLQHATVAHGLCSQSLSYSAHAIGVSMCLPMLRSIERSFWATTVTDKRTKCLNPTALVLRADRGGYRWGMDCTHAQPCTLISKKKQQ